MASTTPTATSASSSPASALPDWLARWSFGKTPQQPDNITASEIRAVENPVHANQRVERSFTVFVPAKGADTRETLATTAAATSSVAVCSPGLTVVRVRPELLDEAGPDVVARVHVSSDAEEHLDRLNVRLSEKNTLTIVYDAAKRGTVGHLVTEIDVPRESQVKQVQAMCGGDVVVDGGVFGSSSASPTTTASVGERAVATSSALPPTSPTLVAMLGSRLFLSALEQKLDFDSLYLAALGSSSVHVEAQHLATQRGFLAGVLGTGRVDVRATHFGTSTATFAAVGTGNVQLTATHAFHADGIDAILKGDGLIRVTTPPEALVEACRSQEINVKRSGTVDLADVPSNKASIELTRPYKGTARVRAPTDQLAIECPDSASDSGARVEYVGELPVSASHTSASALLKELSDNELASVRAEWDARADAWQGAVAIPTIQSAFETPVPLDGPHEGWLSPVVGPLVRCVLPF